MAGVTVATASFQQSREPVVPQIESSSLPSVVANMSALGANLRSFSFVLAVSFPFHTT